MTIEPNSNSENSNEQQPKVIAKPLTEASFNFNKETAMMEVRAAVEYLKSWTPFSKQTNDILCKDCGKLFHIGFSKDCMHRCKDCMIKKAFPVFFEEEKK